MYAMFLDGYFEIEWRVKKFFCDDDILSKLSDNYLMHDEMGDLGGFQQQGTNTRNDDKDDGFASTYHIW